MDPNTLDEEVMANVRKAFEEPEFNFTKLKKSNKTSVHIYGWLMALIEYHQVYSSKYSLREQI